MSLKSLDTTTTVLSEKAPKGYSRFVFINDGRDYFLKMFQPKYPRVLADHATHEFGIDYEQYLTDLRAYMSKPEIARFYGYLNSGDGLECFLVEIDGERFRPDGRPYHITWSLRPDRYKPVDSNRLIKTKNYQPITSVEAAVCYWWEKF